MPSRGLCLLELGDKGFRQGTVTKLLQHIILSPRNGKFKRTVETQRTDLEAVMEGSLKN